MYLLFHIFQNMSQIRQARYMENCNVRIKTDKSIITYY